MCSSQAYQSELALFWPIRSKAQTNLTFAFDFPALCTARLQPTRCHSSLRVFDWFDMLDLPPKLR